MKGFAWVKILFLSVLLAFVTSCGGGDRPVDLAALTSKPKTFVGSDTCKMCHLEHYDSWKMTLHSRMLQNAQKDRDVIVTEINEKTVREDLAKISGLKVPADQVYVPKIEDIKYTIGSQWKQRYLVEKEGKLYIAPIQYNVDTNRWVNYHEDSWDKNSWILKCGGCHATGVELEKNTFKEPGVTCEACHGKGSWHAALPKTAVFEKRQTIVNPAKLNMGVAVQICGSCHNRGKATKFEGAEWAVGYEPGKALSAYFKSVSFAGGALNDMYANEFSKGHHQQYIDWQQSKHHTEGVTCTSCHFVHQVGMPPTRSQTMAAGSKECLSCHEVVNNNKAHSIHSFGNCVGCHMPRIAKSAESGDLHSHVFVALLPKDTLANPVIPNSCQPCHRHKDADLKSLQDAFDALSVSPKPVGPTVQPVEVKSKSK
jgi:hypothetical protein